MSEPLLIADDLTAGYIPGVNILNGCSLELAEGELVGIMRRRWKRRRRRRISLLREHIEARWRRRRRRKRRR